MPVNFCLSLDVRVTAFRCERERSRRCDRLLLRDLRCSLDCNTVRAVFADDRRTCCVKLLSRIEVEDLDIPCLPVEWLVVKDDQLVRFLTLGHNLATGLFIVQTSDDTLGDLDKELAVNEVEDVLAHVFNLHLSRRLAHLCNRDYASLSLE